METKKVLKERHMRKFGYVLKDVEYSGEDAHGCEKIILKQAFTEGGLLIGQPKDAVKLCKKMGIKPELANPGNSVCSIGFCTIDNKWFGWSHRAIYGFTIGSTCKFGDCHYKPKDRDDALRCSIDFWSDKGRKNVRAEWAFNANGDEVVMVSWECVDEDINIRELETKYYPEDFGRGEWVAETMEDAKQMAIDFARGVS